MGAFAHTNYLRSSPSSFATTTIIIVTLYCFHPSFVPGSGPD
jgi:hypothetical protein